ncbi:multiple epidermal growth factor-like domains protein 11, partial [Saccostrea echinata]|uniref:multiple epidermal growth factor-like domains protein 11 n=1 Tax=Saccostrea echinata TaxID=191078 RepID=UPI002A817F29
NYLILDCNLGFSGINCSQKCGYPSYGLKCQGFCKCQKRICNSVNGCSFHKITTYSADGGKTSCHPGYFGINCSWPCRYSNYGDDCQSICNCEKSLCNITYGCISVEGESMERSTLNADHGMPRTDFPINITIVSGGFLLVIMSIIVAALISTKHISNRIQRFDNYIYSTRVHHVTNRSFDTSGNFVENEGLRRPVSARNHLYYDLT